MLVWTDPVSIEKSATRTDWTAVGREIRSNRGNWALVALENPGNWNSRAAILQRASWLRTKRFADMPGFEAKVDYTELGPRGVFVRVR